MDARVWEALIPHMGYMALIRNLRNFEKAGISDEAKAKVVSRIQDEDEVSRSRQFPFRFYSAYKHSSDFGYAGALEKALDMSVANIPVLPGRTLVLIDDSGSMTGGNYSKRSTMTYAEQAKLFGVALAKRNRGRVDARTYSSEPGPPIVGLERPVLRIMESLPNVGGATYTNECIHQTYDGHDRVIVLTDGQAWDGDDEIAYIKVPIYTFDIAGYGRVDRASGKDGRYLFGGGLTDAAFKMLQLLEAGKDADWPF